MSRVVKYRVTRQGAFKFKAEFSFTSPRGSYIISRSKVFKTRWGARRWLRSQDIEI